MAFIKMQQLRNVSTAILFITALPGLKITVLRAQMLLIALRALTITTYMIRIKSATLSAIAWQSQVI